MIYLIALLKKLPQHYYELFLFLAFAEYYFFLPGAITAPRYQIPALPALTVNCALVLAALADKICGVRKKDETSGDGEVQKTGTGA